MLFNNSDQCIKNPTIRQKFAYLSNDVLKALPSTPIILVPKIAENRALVLNFAMVQFRMETGLGNIDVDYSDLYISSGFGTQAWLLVNDSGQAWTQMTTYLGTATPANTVRTGFIPQHQAPFPKFYSAINPTGYNTSSGDPAGPLQLNSENSGAGNFTGGHVNNYMRLFLQYSILNLENGMFE